MDGSPGCACTNRTFVCSIHPTTPAEWIASQRASLASLLALPENKKAQQMFAGNSLPKSSASWMPSDPNISFSKMYQDCSQADPRLAYVAGLIDGEGCIGIQKNSKHDLYYTEVTIGMTSKALPILMEMKSTFGGGIQKKRDKTDRWEEAHNWRIGGEGAASFLTKILPFLMLKRRQAELAIALETLRQKNGWNETTRLEAAKMKDQMHALNKKGPDAPNAAEGWYETEPDLFGTQNRLSGPFPRWGMTRAGQLFPLPMLALRTCASGGGALQNVPTPTTQDNAQIAGQYANPKSTTTLGGFVKLFPTPTAQESGGRFNRSRSPGAKLRPTLQAMAKHNLWPTPTASLGTNGGRVTPRKSREGGTLIEAVSARTFPTQSSNDWKGSARGGQRRGQLTDPDMGAIPAGGKLSPVWVEWLMGWPLGWTASKHSATAKSRSRRPSHGGCSVDR